MSFNKLQSSNGPYFLAPGESVGIEMWYGDPGDDYGAQWIMADPNPENQDVDLTVSDFTKKLRYPIGVISENGAAQYSGAGTPYYRYGVTVTNSGQSPSHFTIQGGGNE